MKAAYPFIDDFLPAGTLASLERLGEVLAGAHAGDRPQGLGRHARDERRPLAWASSRPMRRRRGRSGSDTIAADRARPLT